MEAVARERPKVGQVLDDEDARREEPGARGPCRIGRVVDACEVDAHEESVAGEQEVDSGGSQVGTAFSIPSGSPARVPAGANEDGAAGDDVLGGVELDPPRRVVFTWGWEGNDDVPPGSSTVEVTLTPDGEATILRLVHRDLPEEQRAEHDGGWKHFLPRLADAAARGEPGSGPGAG